MQLLKAGLCEGGHGPRREGWSFSSLSIGDADVDLADRVALERLPCPNFATPWFCRKMFAAAGCLEKEAERCAPLD
ncbi:hypothetical protein, partial [Mesorhizobium sp.]|uniref:hypothetical protein n=1 Tax=Mesorhizobium sp. TaxID=1871066 RepID=UPI0025C40B71